MIDTSRFCPPDARARRLPYQQSRHGARSRLLGTTMTCTRQSALTHLMRCVYPTESQRLLGLPPPRKLVWRLGKGATMLAAYLSTHLKHAAVVAGEE